MHLAAVRLDLRFDDCRTVSERRRRTKLILEKLRDHFNVSVADLGASSSVDETTIAAAAVGRDRRELREVLERIAEAVAAYPHAVVSHLSFREV